MCPTSATPNPECQPPRCPTLAAILTPLGQGGIAVLHVVGQGAFDLAAQLFRHASGGCPEPDARRFSYGHIVDDGDVVDEVLVRLVPPAEAPGRQPLVEVNCHGGLVAVQQVLASFVRRGAQAIGSDELLGQQAPTRVAAEATRALARAATPLGVETLLDQLDGALERALTHLPWHEPSRAAAALRALLATERLGNALWLPPSVAIAGPANAGKSTLFNALAREDRMIVSPTPGTTRDTVTAEVALGGIPLWLADTAGQRVPGSAIEEQAIARARAAVAEAGLVLLVLDASAPLAAPLAQALDAAPSTSILVLNKADLGLAPWTSGPADAVVVSAVQGDGLDVLISRVVEALVGEATYGQGRPVVFTARQAHLLRQALEAIGAGVIERARHFVSEIL